MLKGFTFLSLLLLLAADCRSDSMSKAALKAQMQGYISQAHNLAQSKSGEAAGSIAGWSTEETPLWYGGNDLGVLAIVEDLIVNLFHDFPHGFLDCFGFKTHGFCYKKIGFIKVPIGFKVSYRWPIQQVHSRRFFTNRYLPTIYYTALKASGYYEQIWNPAAQNMHAPMAIMHASVQSALQLNTKSWAPYIPFHGPILPKLTLETASVDLDEPEERGRYDGGKIDELDQVEYSIAPALAHIVWAAISQYFTFLQLLPCVPPSKFPLVFGSDDPGFIHLTRDAFMGFALTGDATVRTDLSNWMVRPQACQEWMMNPSRQNIPYNLYQANVSVLNPMSILPNALTPMPSSSLAQYDRMCTRNWGGSIPFTTTHQIHDTGFISAGKNFEKAIRLGNAIDATLIKGTSLSQYIAFYPLNKQEDRYQLTYKDEWECKALGTPAKPFAGADVLHEPAEHGLYSMTHWKRMPTCCMKFGEFFDFVDDLGSMY